MKFLPRLLAVPLFMVLLASCSNRTPTAPLPAAEQAARLAHFSSLFASESAQVAAQTVPCVLSGGTETRCYSVTVKSVQAGQAQHPMGPWCPRNIADGPDKAGIWLHAGKVHDADGRFVENLATFFNDDQWQLYDPATGDIKVTDTKAACLAAARPDVDPQYQNYCVECLPSYVDVVDATTYLIPVEPVPLQKPGEFSPHSGVGLAFNGVKFDAPAPVHAILGAHTLAPFDDCGGHVNPHAGYHYHAVTGCSKGVAAGDHGAIVGYAMDGYPLLSRLDTAGKTAGDLDACGGHEAEGLGYHYHANDPGKNQIIGCFQAEQGCAPVDGTNNCKSPWWRGLLPGGPPG